MFGNGEAALRSLSALLGVAVVATVFIVGRTCFSRPAGWWSAWIVATAPSAIGHSREARMYTLLPLVALLSTFALVRFLRNPTWPRRIAYVVATTSALYAHNFALFLLPVHAGIAVAAHNRRILLEWIGMLLAVGLAYLPWLPTFWQQFRGQDTYAWFEAIWGSWRPWDPILATLQSFSPTRGGAFPWLYGALALLGWTGAPRGWGIGRIWLPALTAGPVLASLIASHLGVPHYVPGRVDQMVFPTFALSVALGLLSLRPRLLRAGVASAIVVVGVASAVDVPGQASPTMIHRTERELAADLASDMDEGDLILCTSLSRAPLEYYLRRQGLDNPIESYPGDTADHLGGQDDAGLLARREILEREADRVISMLRRRSLGQHLVYLVKVESEVNAILWKRLQSDPDLALVGSLGRYHQAGLPYEMTVWTFRSRR